MKKITIKEIAKEAGVSVSTVSNVLNNKSEKVSGETKNHVLDIVAKYDYSLNLNARSMVTKISNMIGVFYYTINKEVDFSNPFFSDILTGIEYKSKQLDKFILVHGFSNIDDIKVIQQNWSFDGFIVIGAVESIHDELYSLLNGPTIFIDTYSTMNFVKTPFPRYYIFNDDQKMSFIATKFLIERGHRDLVMFSPILDNEVIGVIHERMLGFMKACREFEISFDKHMIIADSEWEKLKLFSEKYTAVLANSDLLASQIISFWKDNNIIGKSVISFDNSFFSKFINPKLTTIDLSQKEKGIKAVEILMKAISNPNKLEKKYYIEGELIRRESVIDINKN